MKNERQPALSHRRFHVLSLSPNVRWVLGAGLLHRGHRFALATCFLLLTLTCGKDEKAEEGRPYTGRLIQEVSLVMPDGLAASLTPDQRAELEMDGALVDDATNTLVFPPAPLKGRFIKAGDRYILSDEDGLFRIPSLPNSATELEMYRDVLGGAARLTAFAIDPAGYNADDQTAPDHVYSVQLPLPGEMNPEENSTQAVNFERLSCSDGHEEHRILSDGCSDRCNADDPAVVENRKGCCQDYNGNLPFADMQPRNRKDPSPSCQAKAYLNFPNSTCAKWSTGQLGSACQNEVAYQCFVHKGSKQCSSDPPRCKSTADCPDATLCRGGKCNYPNCYINHRYRNCQNLDSSALKVTPSGAVEIAQGASIEIKFLNNTEANEAHISGLEGGENGSLTLVTKGPKLVAGPTLILQQYNDDANKHYEEVTLKYTAPGKANRCEMGGRKITLTFWVANSAPQGPKTVSLTFTIKSAKKLRANPGAFAVSPDDQECEPPDEPGSDILTVDAIAQDWASGDAIGNGPGTLRVQNWSGPDDIIEVVTVPIDASGRFHFTIDCTNGGGPCAGAVPIDQYCGGGINSSTPTLRLVSLDAYSVDSIYVKDTHIRPDGDLFHSPNLYDPAVEFYSYIWASEPATVTGRCKVGLINLTLKRGWNSMRVVATEISTATPPGDFPWYYINVLTDKKN